MLCWPTRRGRRALFHRNADGAVSVEFALVLPALTTLMLASIELSSYFWARSRVAEATNAAVDLTSQSSMVTDSSLETVFGAADAIVADDAQTSGTVTDFRVRLTSALACSCDRLDAGSGGSFTVGGAGTGEEGHEDEGEVEPGEPVEGEEVVAEGDSAPPLGASGADEEFAPVETPDGFCFISLWSHEHDGERIEPGYPFETPLLETPDDLAVKEDDTILIAEMSYRYRPRLSFVLPEEGFIVTDVFYVRPRSSDRVVHVGSQARDVERRCEE